MANEPENPLQELFVDQLKDLYSAENQIIRALPKMAKNASNPELRAAFEAHLEETRMQVERLDQIAEEMGIRTLKGKKCAGMEGLLELAKLTKGRSLTEGEARTAGSRERW